MSRSATILFAVPLTLAACGSDSATDDATDVAPGVTAATSTDVAESDSTDAPPVTSTSSDVVEQQFPDVIDAVAVSDGETWTFDVTISSPYDSAERYADAWRVVGLDGTEFGIRELDHDHASEQPFTRSQSGIEIPADVTVVTVEGRDQEFGWGGMTFEITLPTD